MDLQGFYKINEPEFPKSILKKKSQYDQKSKRQTDSFSKPAKTIRFSTEIQKKSKLFPSLRSTLLSNKSNKEKEGKRNEKIRNRSDKQETIKREIEGKVENLQKRFELFEDETTDSAKKNNCNSSRPKKSDEKGVTSKQKTEVEVEKHLDKDGAENLMDQKNKLGLVETEKIVMKKDSVNAGVKNNERGNFSEYTSEERKYVGENVDNVSLEEKVVKKRRRRRRKRKRGNKGQSNNSNVYSLS